MICPICTTETLPLYTIEKFSPPFQIRQCPNCGLQMQEKIPENSSKLYQAGYYTGQSQYSYIDERKSKNYDNYVWQARLQNIRRFIAPPADLLDIGCAFGGFIEAAQAFGYRSQGLDISNYAVDYAHSQGLKTIHQGSLETSNFPNQSFDIISLIEVMEHLPDPCKTLEALSRIIRPGGLVLLQTANFLGWQARLQKNKYHYYLPGHLFYYSTKNLRLLFRRYGFDDFHFFRGVDFGLIPKLRKSRKNFTSYKDYWKWLAIISYHSMSRLAYKDFALTSSMVMYALKKKPK